MNKNVELIQAFPYKPPSEEIKSRYQIAKLELDEAAIDVEKAKEEKIRAIKAEEKALARAGLLQAIADHLEEDMNNKLKSKK